MIYKKLSILLLLLSTGLITISQSEATKSNLTKDFSFRAVAEIGYLGVLDHKIQFSNNGTYFDYRKVGGQDVLFPVSRYSLELQFKEVNTVYFLYQPLRLESQVLLSEDLVVDNLIFPASSSVKLLYNFPFYRVSYLRELFKRNNSFKLGIGASLQIRNATISFESTDGSRFRTNRDMGLVPALKIKSKKQLSNKVYLELEADGIYAPVSYLNGSTNEIIGAILDLSLRTGVELDKSVKSFLNLRYLGGGAVGTSEKDDGPGDGYVKNWLHFYTVSVGFIYEWKTESNQLIKISI